MSSPRDRPAASRASMAFELWDAGLPVGIDLRPPDEVVDAVLLERRG